MYAAHFGLKQDPFSIAPDPRYLFMSERHREALAHLLYGVGGGGGFVLLSGEIGTGKTTVCRCFLEQIPADCHVAYIFNPKLTVRELLKSVCDEFHIVLPPHPLGPHATSAKQLTDALNAFLLKTHAVGQNCVLIIDEAQNLSADVLEQLRLLTNLETNERKLLQIVLIGQSELRRMVARPELEQLAQRVIARYHLDALTPKETARYIQHRLSVAGLRGVMPFSKQAVKRVQQLSRGVPRRINLLCGRAMLGAYATGQAVVTLEVLDKAAGEVFGPVVTTDTPTGTAPHAPFNVWAWGAAAAGLGLLVVAAVWWLVQPRDQLVVPASAGPRESAASSAPATTATVFSATPNTATATVQTGLPAAPIASSALPVIAALAADENQAWRALATLWRIDLPEGDACAQAARQQLQCFRNKNITLAQIRQLGRPGLLTVLDEQGQPQQALLMGLGEQTATLGQGNLAKTVSLTALAQAWKGDFATFWIAPASYDGTVKPNARGPVVDWLAQQLAGPGAVPAPAVFSDSLRQKLQTFQRAQGLPADGQPGPMTLMQLNRAAGLAEPRLRVLSP